MHPENIRLAEDLRREKNWKRWGPYLAERQWGTVREDYSANGDSWNHFPYQHSHSRVYRWGEDGLLGWTDRECRLCFSTALWNGKDPHLKERPFGLSGPEGNHGEDVKECYYYLDALPTYSYCKGLYKYPQHEFPYQRLLEENRKRGLAGTEYELLDTGIFNEQRYFNLVVEYAKDSPNDILIRLTISNQGPDRAVLHVLPTLWFRNTWVWGCKHEGCTTRPTIIRKDSNLCKTFHPTLGPFFFAWDSSPAAKEILFTDNETNNQALFNTPNSSPYTKDAFHRYLIKGQKDAVKPKEQGTKVSPYYLFELAPGEEQQLRLRLYQKEKDQAKIFTDTFNEIFDQKKEETDLFYQELIPGSASEQKISRQAYAGLLWSKQFYHYIVKDWLEGDQDVALPPAERWQGRNSDWLHLFNRDVISVPDKWEYPWYASWDLAFHMIPFAKLDPAFARKQLILFLREWYMHPNGQIPAYEYSFSDVNPPVHAWAVRRVYQIAGKNEESIAFLESAFQKLVMNFTWWVNRKDPDGNNLFAGGFLGLDNIGIFDRSSTLPTGGFLHQADGTAWMGFYCLTMLAIALELAEHNPVYEDMASKFFEHFVAIADAVNSFGGTGLWDEEDNFYYDQLLVDGRTFPLRTRSLVGLLPLIAVEVLVEDKIKKLPGFMKRMNWFLANRPDLAPIISFCESCGAEKHRLLSMASAKHLKKVLQYMLDENEFLSPFGIRSLSRIHQSKPYIFQNGNQTFRVDYVPGEGDTLAFGGNSNWRGPIWLPTNFLLIEALEKYQTFFGPTFSIEYPTGSGEKLSLGEVAKKIAARISSIFLPDPSGKRPCHGNSDLYASHPDWKDLMLFHEYFHADTGAGLGANHQTGWTALVVNLLEKSREESENSKIS